MIYILDDKEKEFKVVNESGTNNLTLVQTRGGFNNYSINGSRLNIRLENNIRYELVITNKDINERLSVLEKETFGQSYDNDAFFDRVDRLKAKIKPKSFMDNALAQSSNDYFDGDIIPLDKEYSLSEYGSSGFDYEEYNARHQAPARVNLASVERAMFKKSFNKEEINNRLTRLENTMFGTTFEDDTQQNRINRIASAYNAQKSANKYDSNKFTQNMAAATQIGMLILMILACVL